MEAFILCKRLFSKACSSKALHLFFEGAATLSELRRTFPEVSQPEQILLVGIQKFVDPGIHALDFTFEVGLALLYRVAGKAFRAIGDRSQRAPTLGNEAVAQPPPTPVHRGNPGEWAGNRKQVLEDDAICPSPGTGNSALVCGLSLLR